jgi:hypothetical protein
MKPEHEHAALLKQIQQWHEDGQHEKIEKAVRALPEAVRDHELSGVFARALNNLGHYEEALRILESFREQGRDTMLWNYRIAYSLYFLDREKEAIPYFERAIALGDDYPDTYTMLGLAKKTAKKHWETNDEKQKTPVKTGAFVPKAFATIMLNMRLKPGIRASSYEDGLDLMLRDKGLGYVSGGGTQRAPGGEIESCTVEINLADDSEETRRAVFAAAEKLEVAKGSKLKYRCAGDRVASEHPIGKLEGFAVYLNGTDLPDEVYRNNKLQDVGDALFDALKKNGALVYSYWRGPGETALYFYGEGGVEAMLAKAEPILKTHPLCEKCRIVRLA